MARMSMIAALGQNRVLGKDNQLLWRIPDDLKRFKQLTLGHPVIMGRKTFESILATLGKPLPDRMNIVVTRDTSWEHQGAIAASSIEDAIMQASAAPGSDEVFVIGGGDIYRQALPFADRLYLTLIDDTKEGDVFFPTYEYAFTRVIFEEGREQAGLRYRWIDLER